MFDGLRRRVRDATDGGRRGLAALPRGLRIAGAIFLALMWVLGAQYLAADVGLPLATALGASTEATLAAAYLVTFGLLLVAPFVILLDWEFGESARDGVTILLLMAWFVAADRLADVAAATFGLPYTPVVVVAFLLPMFAIAVYRVRTTAVATSESG